MYIYYNIQDNKTPLHYGTEKGNQSILQALLDKGASVDRVDIVNNYITMCTFIIITV